MNYKVLWIDDDYKKQIDFIGEAEQEGIDIVPFESHEEGFTYLMMHKETLHGVILDAKVKNKKEDIVTGLEGLRASRDRLIEINKNDYLPYFIFTGQPDYVQGQWFSEAFGKYYIKSDDNESLFKDLKLAIDRKVEYIIQKKHKDIFEICSDKYIGKAASKIILEILVYNEQSNEMLDDEKFFNSLRKVIEYVFRASNKLGILHDKCIQNGNVNLTWSSMFMAGSEVELKPSLERIRSSKPLFPLILANNVKSVLDITSAASHTEEERLNGRVNFSQYKNQIKSNYLLQSLTFQVMDLLFWFKKYADNNPDIEENKSFWKPQSSHASSSEWIQGCVSRIAENGWATFKSEGKNITVGIPRKLVLDNALVESSIIAIRTEPSPDGTKTFIKEIRKI